MGETRQSGKEGEAIDTAVSREKRGSMIDRRREHVSRGGADMGGTEYDDGTTSSTRQAIRMEERHDAPAEAPRQSE